jgi:hypothetical protein
MRRKLMAKIKHQIIRKTLFLLLVTVLSCTHSTSHHSERAPQDFYDTISIKTFGQKVYIPVKINDHIDWYLFDTGAGTLVSKKTCEMLGADTSNMVASADLFNNRRTIPEILIREMSIGNIKFNNITAGVSEEYPDFQSDCKIYHSGIMGSNAFRDKVVRVDLLNGYMIISSSTTKYNLHDLISISLKYNGKQKSPVITISIPQFKYYEELIFDTGADDFYAMSLNHFTKLTGQNKFNKENNVQELVENKSYSLFGKQKDTINYQFNIDTLLLNNMKFCNVKAKTYYSKYSLIGARLMGLGIVTIDFINDKFYFENYRKGHSINLNHCRFEWIWT